MGVIDEARRFAVESHERSGHTRSNGDPYRHHPARVAASLAKHGLSAEVQAAAWLHDVPEDCAADVTACDALLAEIERRCGPAVAAFTREVTNFFGASSATMEEKQQRLIEHASDLSDGAKWIKLSDRLDNTSDMAGWTGTKQQRYAQATLRLMQAIQPVPQGAEALAAEIARIARPCLANPGSSAQAAQVR